MGYSRLLRKVAERVLRDITIIIFRRFSESSSLHLLREQHLHNHKITGMQVKRQRSMRIASTVKGEEESKQAESDSSKSSQQAESDSSKSPQQAESDSSKSPQQMPSVPNPKDPPAETPATVTPSPVQAPQPGWDAAALRIITFLSSRINPNVSLRSR